MPEASTIQLDEQIRSMASESLAIVDDGELDWFLRRADAINSIVMSASEVRRQSIESVVHECLYLIDMRWEVGIEPSAFGYNAMAMVHFYKQRIITLPYGGTELVLALKHKIDTLVDELRSIVDGDDIMSVDQRFVVVCQAAALFSAITEKKERMLLEMMPLPVDEGRDEGGDEER